MTKLFKRYQNQQILLNKRYRYRNRYNKVKNNVKRLNTAINKLKLKRRKLRKKV